MDFIKLTDAGLKISSRAEIYTQLATYAKAAYGEDLLLEEGTAFNSFLWMLADGLSTVSGSVQSFSELFSTKELSGAFLDFVAGRRGVIRKQKGNQRMMVTCTVNSSSDIVRPFFAGKGSIYIQDNKGRTWVNTTQLQIHQFKFLPSGQFSTVENYQGTCEFGLLPLDGYDADLLYAFNGGTQEVMEAVAPTDPSIISAFTFQNHVNADPAVFESENDAQFRARYDQAAYSNAVSTVEGLKANLLKYTDYVRIVENSTDSSATNDANPYGLNRHSIWCIVGGKSTSEPYDPSNVLSPGSPSTDSSDISIAQTILNYKSLGCGVDVYNNVPTKSYDIGGVTYYTGSFGCVIPVETAEVWIPFTRLCDNRVTFSVVLSTSSSDGALRDTVRERVSLAMQEYVSKLQPGDVITFADSIAAIQSVLSDYDQGKFDVVSCTTSYEDGNSIMIYQKAVGGTANVTFSDE